MKLKFTRARPGIFSCWRLRQCPCWAAFAVFGRHGFFRSGTDRVLYHGIAVLFLAAQKGAPAKDKRNYTF